MATRKFDSEKTWFTADTHFGHKGALRFRPENCFPDVDAMNALIMENWNSVIKPGDTVFHLGDFYLGKDLKEMDWILGNLNGNLTFIAGNHDHKKERKVLESFGSVHDILQAKTVVNGKTQFVAMCHYPLRSWNQMHYGAFHFHGHCHGSLTGRLSRSVDVGCDNNLFTPYHYLDLHSRLDVEENPATDHHTA